MHDVRLVTWNNQFETFTLHDTVSYEIKNENIVKLIGNFFIL